MTHMPHKQENKELVCIRCPLGCMITVSEQSDGALLITGNTCPRGAEYARGEAANPTRTVTTTVRVRGGADPVVPVKTKTDIPKGLIMQCMRELKEVGISAPVHIGDVAAANIAGTGVDVVATGNVESGL